MSNPSGPDVSICIVSLDCSDVLKDCLDSLGASIAPFTYEVIVVDNASTDGVVDELKARGYPKLRIVQNDRNVGFTKATNQGIQLSSGKHILWLNADTVLNPGSLSLLVKFLNENPKAGIVGPKVLNPDGTFKPQCRRGMPTPWASLTHSLKLDRFWPQKTIFGQYLLTYLPVDQVCPVDAVSGCCLMARREVWESIGPLDEAIFGFGEDLDWCVRAKQAGWEVWYYPQSVIVHLKGQGGVHAKPYHKVFGIHQAMWVFYRKHLASKYPWIVGIFVSIGIGISFIFSIILTWLRRLLRIF